MTKNNLALKKEDITDSEPEKEFLLCRYTNLN